MRVHFRRLVAAVSVAVALMAFAAPQARAETRRLEIDNMPILPVARFFVTLEEGRLAGEGLEAVLMPLQAGPAMV